MLVEALKFGAIGLAFVLVILAFRLLQSEQSRNTPRRRMLAWIGVFMVFALLLGAAAFFLEVKKADPVLATPGATSAEFAKTIEGQFQVTGQDVDWSAAKFTARNKYSGFLELKTQGVTATLSGDLMTTELTGTAKGTAKFSGSGLISGTVVAGSYTYGDGRIRGFGSFYFSSDSAGKNATLDVIFRPTTGSASRGKAELQLTRSR